MAPKKDQHSTAPPTCSRCTTQRGPELLPWVGVLSSVHQAPGRIKRTKQTDLEAQGPAVSKHLAVSMHCPKSRTITSAIPHCPQLLASRGFLDRQSSHVVDAHFPNHQQIKHYQPINPKTQPPVSSCNKQGITAQWSCGRGCMLACSTMTSTKGLKYSRHKPALPAASQHGRQDSRAMLTAATQRLLCTVAAATHPSLSRQAKRC